MLPRAMRVGVVLTALLLAAAGAAGAALPFWSVGKVLRRVDGAEERAARLAGGLDLAACQPGAADRAGLLERVFECALFKVHDRD